VAKLPKGKPGNGAPVLPKGTLALPVELKKICARPTRTVDEIFSELENYNSAIDVSLSIKALDEEYNRILAGTNFQFEANCKCCTHNSTYIDSRISDIMEQRPKLIAEQNKYKLSAELKKELENAQNYAHNQEMIAREEHNAKVEETNRYYDNCDYIEYKNALDKFYAALTYEINQNEIVKSYNAKLAAYVAYDAWSAYSRAAATIKKYSSERMALETKFAGMCIYAHNIADALQKEINAAQDAEKYIARKKYLRDNLPAAIASDVAKNRMQVISADRSCLFGELIAINNQISNTKHMIVDHENENLILENYKRKMPQLTADKKRIASYLKLITGGKIRQAVIGAHLQQLIKHVNTFLRDIASFSLSYTIKTGLDININEPGKMERDVTSGSGFQKHIISLAFRMTLTRLYPHAGQFMLIDEGFNTFDPNNISLAAQILRANADSYMAIVLVTHNPDLKAVLDHDIRINIENGVSKVVDFVTPFNMEPFQEIQNEAAPTDKPAQEKAKKVIGTYVCVCGKSMKNVPSTIKGHVVTKTHRDYIASHPQNQPAPN
jgi:DNA repair exonuclease SbcCD ATPase subunit